MNESDISLRAIEPSDIELLYKWENDKSIWHLSNTLAPFSRFVLEQYILTAHQDIYTTKQLRLMIDFNAGGMIETIGSIDLFDYEPKHKRAGVGILLDINYRSKGFASKALDVLIDYCFNTLNLKQLYCNIAADNEVSIKLFKKHNFQEIGLKKDWLLINNKWVDEYLFQLINNE